MAVIPYRKSLPCSCTLSIQQEVYYPAVISIQQEVFTLYTPKSGMFCMCSSFSMHETYFLFLKWIFKEMQTMAKIIPQVAKKEKMMVRDTWIETSLSVGHPS